MLETELTINNDGIMIEFSWFDHVTHVNKKRRKYENLQVHAFAIVAKNNLCKKNIEI